ncbi:MAG: hypothetical protein HXX17_11910 [Geobacteraceae bacterium]|nr:hypothetical protein [Geobacteraceae bacterium]
MSTAYLQVMSEHRRLTILRHLAGPGGNGGINDSILQTICNDFGVSSSRDQVKSALNWLEEQELVSLKRLDSLIIAYPKQRGNDVAKGIIVVDGVQPPSPE